MGADFHAVRVGGTGCMTGIATGGEARPRDAVSAARLIVAASLGNALEFYEILVYGYFAVTIAKVFFPAANPTVSLLVTLGTVGISYFGPTGRRNLSRQLRRPARA